MTTPRAEGEPAWREETGVGWPGAPPPKPARPASPSPERSSSLSAQPSPSTPAAPPARSSPAPTRPFGLAGPAARRPVEPPPTSPVHSTARRSFERQSPPQRPGTVTAAAAILFVGAGIGLLACCGLNLIATDADLDSEASNLLLLLSAILVVSGVLNIVFGYFLLQGRQWARVVTIVFSAIAIVFQVVSLLTGAQEGSGLAGSCLGLVLNVIVIGLLSGATASEYFRASRAWR